MLALELVIVLLAIFLGAGLGGIGIGFAGIGRSGPGADRRQAGQHSLRRHLHHHGGDRGDLRDAGRRGWTIWCSRPKKLRKN